MSVSERRTPATSTFIGAYGDSRLLQTQGGKPTALMLGLLSPSTWILRQEHSIRILTERNIALIPIDESTILKVVSNIGEASNTHPMGDNRENKETEVFLPP